MRRREDRAARRAWRARPVGRRACPRATGVPVGDLASQYDNITLESLTIVRDDALGVPGFDIYVPAAMREHVRAKLSRRAPWRRATRPPNAADRGRAPRFGVDMNTETIPLEAGIEDRAISFTKGCYVGQEVIIRVLHRGHGRVARRLVSIVLAGGAVPARGDKILAGERAVGEITSATASPKMRRADRAGLRPARSCRGRHRADGERLTGSRVPARRSAPRRPVETPDRELVARDPSKLLTQHRLAARLSSPRKKCSSTVRSG